MSNPKMGVNLSQNEGAVADLKRQYINSRISFADLSRIALQSFGINIAREALMDLSDHDPEGKWPILRANAGRQTSEVPVSEKMRRVSDKLYEIMINDEVDMPYSQLAQIAKTWLDINTKSNVGLEVSSKVSAQQVKDLLAGELAKASQKVTHNHDGQ